MTECLAMKNLTVRAADSLIAYQLCLHNGLFRLLCLILMLLYCDHKMKCPNQSALIRGIAYNVL